MNTAQGRHFSGTAGHSLALRSKYPQTCHHYGQEAPVAWQAEPHLLLKQPSRAQSGQSTDGHTLMCAARQYCTPQGRFTALPCRSPALITFCPFWRWLAHTTPPLQLPHWQWQQTLAQIVCRWGPAGLLMGFWFCLSELRMMHALTAAIWQRRQFVCPGALLGCCEVSGVTLHTNVWGPPAAAATGSGDVRVSRCQQLCTWC